MDDLKELIREVPDFPKEGISYKDITPLLQDPVGFRKSVHWYSEKAQELGAELILGIDARGFIFGSAVAFHLGLGFIPVRKKGKLPYRAISHDYELEYGSSTLELHVDAVEKGRRIVIIDDLLATGGTANAASSLVRKSEGIVAGHLFLIELSFLDGRSVISDAPVFSALTYS